MVLQIYGAIYGNYGTIKNGYIYGKDIDVTLTHEKVSSSGIVKTNLGTIENVYSLIDFTFDETKNINSVGDIVYNNSTGGLVQNVYSVGDDIGRTNFNYGPTVYTNSGVVNNAYYFSNNIYNNTVNEKITMLALYDIDFQNSVLNAENSFDVNSTVSKGYYPQLNMPACMPKQEYIELPEVKDADLVDILSTEIIEREADSVKVKITAYNPSAETITDIKVKNLQCTILNQEYSDGKSYVTAILNNPTLFVSDYSVLSVTSKGAYNIEYTREFKENERIIKIDLFRKILTIEDWKNINKYPNQNYQLENDLDFKNATDFNITNTYSGIINGNGHEIKNIQSNGAIFNEVKGEIRNLTINNLNIYADTYTVGFINKLNTGKIDKLHIENINIEIPETIINQDAYIGGIVANIENSDIINSSVSNLNIKNTIQIKSNATGGICGIANNSRIYNCWAYNINYKIINVLTSEGIGGIVGKFMNNGELKNCYSEGNIVTESSNVGGIVGRVLSSNIKIYNTYSLVNIESEGEYIGGIVGITSAGYNIYNNIAIGNLYAIQATNNLGRVNGDGESFSNNYAYKNQLINGYEGTNTENVNILSKDKLIDKKTYINNVGFDENFNYDQLQVGNLPKLMDTDKKELLKYQPDISLEGDMEKLAIEDLSYQKEINKVRIRLEIKANIVAKNINISDMEAKIINQINRDNSTYIEIEANPIKYLDSYKISTITYEVDNAVKEAELGIKLDVSFYKEIYTYEDWQNIDENSYENYMLMQDIDFEGKTNIKYNLKINRLISEGKSLKNITLSSNNQYFGIIKQIKSELTGIKFENINITCSKANGNYVGIVLFSNASISDIEFKDIKINANNIGYVAPICSSLNKIENVTINNIEVYGKNYVAGLVSTINQLGTIKQVEGNTIKIEAGTYVGGILGTSFDSSIAVDNIYLDNVNISGENYVGGITGNSSIQSSEIKNSNITGASYVGGITGYLSHRENGGNYPTLMVDECYISGTSQNIGGIAGNLNFVNNVLKIVKNSIIEGLTTKSNNVGGIVGYAQYMMNYCEVINTQIISKGSNVGGISGVYSNEGCNNSLVVNCKIEGYSNVGGIVGSTEGNVSFHNNYVNSNVLATGTNAGGIIGYLANKDMTSTYNTSYVFYSYFANGKISAPVNVGGIIGKIEEKLYNPASYYYSNYVEADISSDNDIYVSLGIGSMPTEDLYLSNTYFYKYSTINGNNPNAQNEEYILEDRYLVEEDLKKQDTYTSKLKWITSAWNYTMLQNNKYPTINNRNLPNQEGIDIPKDSEHNLAEIADTQSLNNTEEETLQIPEQTFEYAGKQITTYSNYSIIEDAEGNSVKRDTKLYLKDGNLFALSPDMDMVDGNFIIDSYNGKEYETVLGTDGKLYDLKEKITYPENFKNEDIKSIGNNLNTEEKEVEVTYNNGDKIKFNYQTGETISEEKLDENKTGLIEFIQDKLETEESAITTNEEGYKNTKELIQKLQEVPIEKAEEIQNNANTQENQTEEQSGNSANYITTYNATSDSFEIYNEEDLLSTTKQTVETENSKIEKNNLSNFYSTQISKAPEKAGKTAIYVIIIAVIIILVLLIRYNINKSKKK